MVKYSAFEYILASWKPFFDMIFLYKYKFRKPKQNLVELFSVNMSLVTSIREIKRFDGIDFCLR